jgi:hypothetical protein
VVVIIRYIYINNYHPMLAMRNGVRMSISIRVPRFPYVVRHASTAFFASLILVAFFFPLPVAAESSPANEQAPPLWSFSDGDSTVYLFGTIHLMREGVSWYQGRVRQAFAEADRLMVEVDQNSISRQKQVELVRSLALLPREEQLSDIIPAEQMQKLEEVLSPLGVPEQAVERWKPWYAAITLAGVAAQQHGFLPKYGVDATLLRKAQERGLPVLQLESAKEQLSLFDSLSREDARYLLRDAIEEQQEMQQLFRDLNTAWQRGQMSSIEELLLDSSEENPSFHKALYTARNRRWTPRIAGLLEKEGISFVAVGAAHLIGEESVIELLEERGIEVRRIEELSAAD